MFTTKNHNSNRWKKFFFFNMHFIPLPLPGRPAMERMVNASWQIFVQNDVQNVVVFPEPQQPKVSDFVPQQNEKNLWLLGVNISVFRAGKPILSLSILTCQRISNSGVAGSLWYLSWNHRQADDQKIGNVQAGRGCWEVPKVSQTPKS